MSLKREDRAGIRRSSALSVPSSSSPPPHVASAPATAVPAAGRRGTDDGSRGGRPRPPQAERNGNDRLQRLYDRLELIPSDAGVSIELFLELFSRRDFVAAEQVARPVVSTKRVPGAISYKYGKCLFRIWKDHNMDDGKYLSGAIAAFREAMGEREISRQPIVYLELATFYMYSGAYQEALNVLAVVSFMFKDVAELVLISQYCVVMITCLSGNTSGACELLMELALFAFSVDLNFRDADTVVLLPYRLYEPFLAFEQAALMHRMGKELQASRLMAETFAQLQLKRAANVPAEVASVLQTIYASENFNSWDKLPENHALLADYFLASHNYFMAAEYRARAAERTASSKGRGSWQAQVRAGDLCATAAKTVLDVRGSSIAVEFAKKAVELSCFDFGCLEKVAYMLGRGVPENYPAFRSYVQQRHAYLLCRRRLLHWLNLVRDIASLRRHKAAVSINSFFRMILTRNRTAGVRLSEVSVLGRERLVQSFKGRLLKTGNAELSMWIDIWNAAATNIQSTIRCWYCKRRYRMSRSGLSTFQALFRGILCRSQLRGFVQILCEELASPKLTILRKSELLLAMKQRGFPFLVNIFESRVLCCGVTCHLRYDSEEVPASDDSVADKYSMHANDSILSSSVIWNRSRLERRFMKEQRSAVLPRGIRSRLRETQLHAAQLSAELMQSTHNMMSDEYKASHSNYFGEGSKLVGVDSAPSTELDLGDGASAGVTDNAVLTIISFVSLGNDASKQWLPMTLMPDSEVERILRVSTHLIISSALFSMYDSRRLFSKLRKNPEWWFKMQSLVVQGCGPRDACVNSLIVLGARHLQNLLLSASGATVRSAKLLGAQLSARPQDISTGISRMQAAASSSSVLPGTASGTAPVVLLPWILPVPRDLSQRVINPCISKICIEHEKHFGDQAVIELTKHIQHCKTMRHLAVVDCGITDVGARSLERLILLNTGIEVIRLDENRISRSCIELMVKAAAAHGVRSSFRQLYVREQTPRLTHSDLDAIAAFSNKVGVKCHLSQVLRDEVDELRASFSTLREASATSVHVPPDAVPNHDESQYASFADKDSATYQIDQSRDFPGGDSAVFMSSSLHNKSLALEQEEDEDARELADARSRIEAKFAEMRRGGKSGSLYKHVYL